MGIWVALVIFGSPQSFPGLNRMGGGVYTITVNSLCHHLNLDSQLEKLSRILLSPSGHRANCRPEAMWARCKGVTYLCVYFFIYLFLYLMYRGVLPVCMSVYHVCIWCPGKPEEGIKSHAN